MTFETANAAQLAERAARPTPKGAPCDACRAGDCDRCDPVVCRGCDHGGRRLRQHGVAAGSVGSSTREGRDR
jgi:hypothetical protein